MKSIFKIFFLCALSMGYSKDGEIAVIPEDDSKDPGLKIGDIAPSWALMSGPGKFEFLKTWTEEKGKRLKKPTTQPDRHVVVLSFFATWPKLLTTTYIEAGLIFLKDLEESDANSLAL